MTTLRTRSAPASISFITMFCNHLFGLFLNLVYIAVFMSWVDLSVGCGR